jgi:hypothetical protein
MFLRYFISIVLPIILITVGLFYAFNIQRKYYRYWVKEVSLKRFLIYAIPTFFKSVIIYGLIIFIHNSGHSDQYVEMILFIFVFFIFSIIQSSYSISAFLSRGESLIYQMTQYYKDKGNRVDKFINKLLDLLQGPGSIIVKILIVIGFIIIFIPNISLFVTTNILYFLLFILLIGLSVIMNNILYFGLISLMVFQIQPVTLSFGDINYIVMFLSYVIILVGLSLENRLERKMFFVVNILEVKKLNFNLGYTQIRNNKQYILYQNQVNHYYYIYFRQIGLVVVYYCDFKVELSNHVINHMIKQGKKSLLSSN